MSSETRLSLFLDRVEAKSWPCIDLQETQDELTSELADLKDKYREVVSLLHDAQEELKRARCVSLRIISRRLSSDVVLVKPSIVSTRQLTHEPINPFHPDCKTIFFHFYKFSGLLFNFYDLSVIAMLNAHLVLHEEQSKNISKNKELDHYLGAKKGPFGWNGLTRL